VYGKNKIDYLKRSFVIFFLLLFTVLTFKFLLFTSFLKSQKKDFRKQLIEQNSEKVFDIKIGLAELFVDKPNFDWKEKGKELVIDGVYHEVIKIKKHDTFILVSLIEDAHENEMFNRYFCLNKTAQAGYFELMQLLLDLNYIDQKISYDIRTFCIDNKMIAIGSIYKKINFYFKVIKPPQPYVT